MTNLLIADSGSTKTEWVFVNNKKETNCFTTKGINPFHMNSEDIVQILHTARSLLIAQSKDGEQDLKQQYDIHFYGAGVSSIKQQVIVDAFQQVYRADKIYVESDLLGAARSLCQDQPGIACILGTGSNSCFYDGKSIVSQIPALGYILGDEGSGALIGKKLVGDILKNQMSPKVTQLFFDYYKISSNDIQESVYRNPLPNRYLAKFVQFVDENIHFQELEELVIGCFNEFIERNVLQYEQARISKINFTGSVAFGFSKQLVFALNEHHLQAGKITKKPMDDLVHYHVHNAISV